MLTPKNFDEVNGNFLFSPKNVEEIRLHLLPLQLPAAPRLRAPLWPSPTEEGMRGQGRGREGGDDDEFEQEQEETIEPTARAAA